MGTGMCGHRCRRKGRDAMTTATEHRRWTDWLDERAEMHVQTAEYQRKRLQREQIERDRRERAQDLAQLRWPVTAYEITTQKSITPRAFWLFLCVSLATAFFLAWKVGLL